MAQSTPVLKAADYNFGIPGVYTIVLCDGCGFHYTNPRPTSSTLGLAYPELYTWGYQRATDPYHLRTYSERLRMVKSLRPAGRLLEIGCSAGHFLNMARQKGYDVLGVEPDERTAAFAREHYTLDVRTATIDAARLPEGHFDVVCLFDVLEHLSTP